jgi:hypothetical protein
MTVRSTVRGDLGDGPLCALQGSHGRTVTMPGTERLWCPACQTIYAPATFSEDVNGFVPGKIVRAGQHAPVGRTAPVVILPTESTEQLHGEA